MLTKLSHNRVVKLRYGRFEFYLKSRKTASNSGSRWKGVAKIIAMVLAMSLCPTENLRRGVLPLHSPASDVKEQQQKHELLDPGGN